MTSLDEWIMQILQVDTSAEAMKNSEVFTELRSMYAYENMAKLVRSVSYISGLAKIREEMLGELDEAR